VNRPNHQKSLPALIAERMRRDFGDSPQPRLPSRRELSRRYGVAQMTITRAARRLRNEGFLRMGQGRRMSLAGEPCSLPTPSPLRAGERLAMELMEHIESGVLRDGDMLPKISYLALKNHVSNKTVSRAYRHLERRGVVTRNGKRRVVGTPPRGSSRRLTDTPPVILLLGEGEFSWRGLFVPRTEGFCRTFSTEADRRGIQLLPVCSTVREPEYGYFAQGEAEIRTLIQTLGDRYQGSLILNTRGEMPDVDRWMDLLSRMGKPVVWFDRHGESFRLPGPRVFHCYFSERRAVELAARYLVESGHRTIGYVNSGQDWMQHRETLLRCGLEALSPDVALVRLKVTTRYPALRRHHVTAYPGLSAIVAPNDHDARHIYYSLRGAGLRIPDDLSLLSFDNYPELIPLPVSTIDFGFDHLGYCSFHLILRDLPIRTDSANGVATRPRLVRRGSVASVPSPVR
jgi:DNA-binding LacI/PurR family transcriptional regulator